MEKTGKWHILAILENDRWMAVSQIRFALNKDFYLKPNVDALWKTLQRCRQQGLISVERTGRNNFCRITEKGKKRRVIIGARKEKEAFVKDKAKRGQVLDPKPTTSALMYRMVEACSSLALCDAVLGSVREENTLDLARWTKTYWQNEKIILAPYVAEAQAKAIDKLSQRFGESVEELFNKAGFGMNSASDRL